ncbi:unnamed protein product, partial [Didymodactylos carnosus]
HDFDNERHASPSSKKQCTISGKQNEDDAADNNATELKDFIETRRIVLATEEVLTATTGTPNSPNAQN